MAGAFVMTRGGPLPLDPQLPPDAPLEAYPENMPEIGEVPPALWQMTGVPLAMQGYGDFTGAFGPEGGGMTDAAIGAAKMGLASVPYISPLARAAYGTLPGAAATGGVMGLSLYPTDAEAREQQRRKAKRQEPPPVQSQVPGIEVSTPAGQPSIYDLAAKRDPRVKLLLDEQRRLQGIISQETTGKGGYGPRAQAAQAKLDEANEALKTAVEPYLPFDQAYPTASKMMSGLGVALPMAAALLTRGTMRAMNNAPVRNMNRSVSQAGKAYDKGNASLANRKKLEVEEYLKRYKEGAAIPSGGGTVMSDSIMPALAGGIMGTEVSLFPDQYNKRNALPGTEEHTLATERLKPENFMSSAFSGAGLGALSGISAGHLFPGRNIPPNVEGGRAIVNSINGAENQAAKAMARDRAAQAAAEAAPAPVGAFGASQPKQWASSQPMSPPPLPASFSVGRPSQVNSATIINPKDMTKRIARELPTIVAEDALVIFRTANPKASLAQIRAQKKAFLEAAKKNPSATVDEIAKGALVPIKGPGKAKTSYKRIPKGAND